VSAGIANPTPADAPLRMRGNQQLVKHSIHKSLTLKQWMFLDGKYLGEYIAVAIPIILPDESRSGPPELPGLIAASVWITFEIGLPVGDLTSLANPLITPVVNV
jgi:hypothetical protein